MNTSPFALKKGFLRKNHPKGSFNVKVKPYLHKRVYVNALQEGISLNNYIEKALEKELEQ